ncbi:MAG: hypothetical protein ABI895_30065 [Deltaproteobacteria bacterium]
MQLRYGLLGSVLLGFLCACSSKTPPSSLVGGGGGNAGSTGVGAAGAGNAPDDIPIYFGPQDCVPQTCTELGWACGYTIDACGKVIDCATEGLACATGEICTGGITGPTQCVAGGSATCEVCSAIPDCSGAPELTRLTGRVITPGRSDGDTGNQVGVPNATVYILRDNVVADLPPISTGIPNGGTSCDRCEDQDLGPVLAGAVTDASGNYTIEGEIPVGVDFSLVVKVGKFRRAVTQQLPASAACQSTALPSALPENPTRLPRSSSDGLAVNIPSIAVSTGQIDAMECVLEKLGIDHTEFGNAGSAARVHLYRGGPTATAQSGARVDDSTTYDVDLYGSLERLQSYDMVVADCEGTAWDGSNAFTQRNASGANVREYLNRGGRLFASHLSFSWLFGNGTDAYSATAPIATGLDPAATWDLAFTATQNLNTSGTGSVSLGRPNASPKIESFADWMVAEGVTSAPNYDFSLTDPRSLATGLGAASEEFVFRRDTNFRTQQFSFSTPYGAPAEASCGRVVHSGFHVAATGGSTTPFIDAVFPAHCVGNLTSQEKVLLYMLFDLGACVGGEPVVPACVPLTCTQIGARCGFAPDGCGNVLDCGACRPPA